MSLPKDYEGFEVALNIVSEIVSTYTGIPGPGSAVAWGIKAILEHFPFFSLKIILNKKNVKALGIPDDKYDFVYEQTHDALSSINSVDYNPAVFRKDIFTKYYYSPTLIGSELIETLHIDEDSDLLKAIRFVLAVYLLHWTEEPDFPLETRQELLLLASNVKKNEKDITFLKSYVKELKETRTESIPAELTVIPKSINALIGREPDIQNITSKIETDHVLCITADGGLGKTAIAKSIINSIRSNIVKGVCEYKYVAWLTSLGKLKEDLLQIRIPDLAMDDQEDKYIKVCRFLQCNPSFIVIDNMDELPTQDEINILNTISGRSTILITTRATNVSFPTYELKPLDRDTSVVFFYNHYSCNPNITNITHKKICEDRNTGRIEDVYKVIDASGRNTLLIELLAKTAHADDLSISELWKRISSGIFGFESKTEVQTDHSGKYPKSKLSVDEQIRRLYSMFNLTDKQKEIISFISLFPAEHDIFSNVFKWAGFFDQGANDMMDLVERGWIDHEDDFYSIHTIVSDSISLQNKKSGNGINIINYERLIENLTDIDAYIPRTIDYNLAQKLSFVPQTVGKLLSENYTSSINIGLFFHNLAILYNNQGNYDEALKYYNIALGIREKTLGKDHPDTAATYNNLAILYHDLGNYDKSLKYYEINLEICKKTLGKDHPSTAATYHNLAGLYRDLGNYDQALKYFKTALEINEKALGKDHPDTATTYNNLAGLYRILGKYDEAMKLLELARDIREKTLGKDHPGTAITYGNLAGLFQDQGNYNEALKYFNMALEIHEKILGKVHPDTATTYNNLARLYQVQGNYDEALKYFNMALDIYEKILGKDHPDTATLFNNLAGLYQEQGKYDEALKYCNMALDIYEKILGKDHPDTAITYNNLAALYQEQGKYDEAMKHFKMALEIREKLLGKEHPDTAASYNNLAALYQEQGKYEEALKYYNMSLEIHEKTRGKNHPDTAASYNNLARLFCAQGKYDKALDLYKMALEIQERILGKDHTYTGTTYNSIAALYHEQGKYDEALNLYKIALEIQEKTLGKNHPDVATTYNNLARLYRDLGNYDQSLKHFIITLEIQEKTLGKDHPDTAITYGNLAVLYHDLGNYNASLKFCKKALEIQEKTLGTDNPYTATTYINLAELYHDLGNYNASLQYYKKALPIQEKMLGKDHPFIAITYSSLANLFRTQNKYDDALEYEKMALEICEKKLGIHQNTANAYENLARLYHETDNYQEAFKYFKKAAEVRKKLGSK